MKGGWTHSEDDLHYEGPDDVSCDEYQRFGEVTGVVEGGGGDERGQRMIALPLRVPDGVVIHGVSVWVSGELHSLSTRRTR